MSALLQRAMSMSVAIRQRFTTRALAAILLVVLGLVPGLALAYTFPPLTGRVVDQANVLTPQAREQIETKLKDLEDKSSIQLVVATVKSLEGGDVETYANELFRDWKLGQEKKNNGALLLVAPNERKVRIEVGYGLEGTLTDALSSVIISSAIIPRFKQGDFSGGVERGVDGIISVLSGDTSEWQRKVDVRQDDGNATVNDLVPLLFFLLFLFFIWYMNGNSRGGPPGAARRGGPPIIFFPPAGSGGWGGGSSGGGFGGGFSGGGGWSGGGGASGSW